MGRCDLPRDSEDARRILKELGKLVERDKMTRGDYILGESFFISVHKPR